MIYYENTNLVSATGLNYTVRLEHRESGTLLRSRTLVNGIVTVVDDRPSVVFYDPFGNITNESWMNNTDWVDRGDSPNEIEYRCDNGINTKLGEFWFDNLGEMNRHLKPSVIVYNADGTVMRKEYSKNDRDITTALDGFTEGTVEFEFQWEMA